jgi:hypothetical protein
VKANSAYIFRIRAHQIFNTKWSLENSPNVAVQLFSTSATYFWSSRFKSRPGDQLSRLRFLWHFSLFPCTCRCSIFFNRSQDRFLSNSSVTQSPQHSTVRKLIRWLSTNNSSISHSNCRKSQYGFWISEWVNIGVSYRANLPILGHMLFLVASL